MKFRKAMHAPMIQAAADLDWEMASSIQLTPSAFDGDEDHMGVLIARPHATGWFVSARCRPGLAGHELDQFRKFASHTAYLLFQEGPTTGSWVPSARAEEWQAFLDADTRDLAVQIPETIPSQWAA